MFSITSNESTLKSSEDEMLHDLMDASLEIFEENDYLTQCLLDDTVVVRNRTGSKTMNEFNVELLNELSLKRFSAVLKTEKKASVMLVNDPAYLVRPYALTLNTSTIFVIKYSKRLVC